MSEAPKVVAVAGMHRSGTSLITRIANLVGVDLGSSSRLMGPGRDNPAGYWENRPLRVIGEEVLEALGGTWDVPPPLPRGWHTSSELGQVRERAARTLDAELPISNGPEWVGWKDPRNSLLVPFWDTIRPIDAVIVSVRRPLAVAESLESRNAMPLTSGLYLWLRYTLTALLDFPGALVVDYEDAVSAPLSVANAIADHLGLPGPSPQAAEAIERHANPELRHHEATSDLADPLLAYANRFYDELPGRSDHDVPAALEVAEPIARGSLEALFSSRTERELQAQLGAVRTELVDCELREENLVRQRDSIREHRDKVATQLGALNRQVERLHRELDVAHRARDASADALEKAFELVNEKESQLEAMRESRDRWMRRVTSGS